uniref:Uncharacterized protein n=1 Tax=Tanacetum cinerariifolium TaxID=118510 RepID=A0A6L2KDF8_TANCI|nr:hypothetical protein [Tanacetum cinerariifolium]
MPKILSLAWETVLEIELAFEDKHCQPEDILELFQRLYNDVQNIHGELAVYINTPNWDRPTVCYDDDDEDYAIAVTPSLSTKESDNSLSMGDEHLDTISATESDKFIKYSVENLVPIPNQFKDFSNSNDESTSIDDDSFSIDNIEYVEASPFDSELVSSEVMEIVIPKVGGIDDDILLTIKDDILHEKLLNVNLLIANIKVLNDNPTPSSDFMTKSSSISLNSLLEETNTFNKSLPEFETFCFDLEEISSGSTTTRSDISLPEYEAFYDDHVKEISSGSTTTHSDSSLYDSFIFDLSINPFLPTDRKDIVPTREPRVHNALPTHPTLQLNLDLILSSESLFAYVFPPTDMSDFTHEEFADELAHIISLPEYDCFYFRNLPDPGKWIPILNCGIRENLSSTTRVNLPVEDDHSPLLAYVVWIFLAYLTYPVIPPYLHSFGNEDTIFDPCIIINRFLFV